MHSNDTGHASQMSYKTTQNNVAYEILKMKFIANILCWASLLLVFVVKEKKSFCCFLSDLQFVYIFIYKVCTDMLLKFYTAFTKKVFVVPKYPSPLNPYPFCVCFIVFYILNRQTEWNEVDCVVLFVCCISNPQIFHKDLNKNVNSKLHF